MLPTYHIIIAEDNASMGVMLRRLVQKYLPNARVTVMWDGAMALAVHTMEPADLIITDYRMPRLDGLELIRQLRASHDQTPIILCSNDDLAEITRVAGANRFVAKEDLFLALPQALTELLALETRMIGAAVER